MEKIADIIIPHHNRHDHLKDCLEEIPVGMFNIIIVSGGTFAENCNKGARLAETDTLIFLNDDTIPTINALIGLVRKEYDIVGIGQDIPGNSNTFWGIAFKQNMKEANGKLDGFMTENIDEVVIPTGFMFSVKRKVWEELKGFDERFRNGGEDSDFGLRALKAGKEIAILKDAIIHKHSQSEGRLNFHIENKKVLFEKWPDEKIKQVLRRAKVIERKMDILVATNHLDRLGGSETFTYTLVLELRSRGHNVDLYTRAEGVVSEVLGGKTRELKRKYDLILINHNTCLHDLRGIVGKKVFTSHGIYPPIEQATPGADRYVAISAEVQQHLTNNGFPSDIILNGIDCNRFKPFTPINEKPKRILCMCQGEEAREQIEIACKELGMEFDFLDKKEWNVEDRINQADIVFSLGRGVYEAMACGRAVIVYDTRSYTEPTADGIITSENISEIIKHNCSGRKFLLRWGAQEIVNAILKYDKSMGNINREYALRNLNIKEQANKYLEKS